MRRGNTRKSSGKRTRVNPKFKILPRKNARQLVRANRLQQSAAREILDSARIARRRDKKGGKYVVVVVKKPEQLIRGISELAEGGHPLVRKILVRYGSNFEEAAEEIVEKVLAKEMQAMNDLYKILINARKFFSANVSRLKYYLAYEPEQLAKLLKAKHPSAMRNFARLLESEELANNEEFNAALDRFIRQFPDAWQAFEESYEESD